MYARNALKQPRFTYSVCGPFTKYKERIQKFKETEDTNYIYRNELDKACFQHDMDYGDFKDLARRTASDKVLRFINFVIKHLQAVVVICLQIKFKSTIG